MTELSEITIPIVLAGVQRTMHFDLNAFSSYQEKTGRSFFTDLLPLWDVLQMLMDQKEDGTGAQAPTVTFSDILARVPMDRLQMLLWASIFDYDAEDNPVRTLTPGRIGRYVNPNTVVPILSSVVSGYLVNLPDKATMGESQGTGAPQATAVAPAPIPARPNGGAASFEPPEGAFDLPAEIRSA